MATGHALMIDLRTAPYSVSSSPDLVHDALGARLPAKSFRRSRIACNIRRQELDRDEPPQFGVLGLVDHTHPSAAKPLNDRVMRDGLSEHGRKIGCAWAMLGAVKWNVNGLNRVHREDVSFPQGQRSCVWQLR